MYEHNLEDLVMVKTKCRSCQSDGQAPTFQAILSNEQYPLTQMIKRLGYVEIDECNACSMP